MPPTLNTPTLENNELENFVIDPESLGSQPTLPSFEQPEQPPIPEQPNFADLILAGLDEEETSAQKADTGLRSAIAGLLPELQGEGRALLREEARQDLPQLRRDLLGINNRIRAIDAELFQDDVSLAAGLQEIEDKPIAMEFITGEAASLENRARIARAFKVAEKGMLNVQGLALQGSIGLAEDMAKKVVAAKYSPIREALATYRAQLDLITPIVDRDEKKQQERRNLQVQFAVRDLDKREKEESEIASLGMKISGNGAPADIVSRVTAAKTLTEAINLARPYMSDPLERQLKNAQLTEANRRNQLLLQEIQENEAMNSPEGANELKNAALATANDMLVSVLDGSADAAVGGKGASSLFGLKKKPIAGTRAANFVNLYDNMKALLSLDNIKLLKGQGQISDGERQILEDASSKLNRNTSEGEFERILLQTISALGGDPTQLDPYAEVKMGLPTGYILVEDTVSGDLGSIPEREFNPTSYNKL